MDFPLFSQQPQGQNKFQFYGKEWVTFGLNKIFTKYYYEYYNIEEIDLHRYF
jgi:hypothetical protein